MKLPHAQPKARAGLVAKKAACGAAKGAAVASEAAPVHYVAAVFGVTDPEMAIGGWC